ncbi:MAG: DUF4185 domain-containing protein [Treponema sp.]|nr:DUF4185 domain-containing protein [Treponema sp.]
MKKNIYSFITAVILAALVSGCPGGPENGTPSPPFNPSAQPGEAIRLTAYNSAYETIVNNSGMSGSRMGYIHFHSNSASDMYAGSKQDLIFDIGRIDQLGELHVWNYNSGGGSNGLRDVTISYSADNVSYTELDKFTLKQATGAQREAVSNLQNGSFIHFNGVPGRYIKIAPDTNYGGGQWGLSEIRLFRYRNAVYRGAYIAAAPIMDIRREAVPPEYFNLTNGAGLSHPASHQAVHDNNPNHMYSIFGSTAIFDIDLHGRYPIQQIAIWNYNEPGRTARGMSSVTISSSDDAVNFTSRGTFPLSPGTGENGLRPTVLSVNFSGRFIRVSGSSIGAALTGLSAIRCYVGEGYYADKLNNWTGLLSNYPQSAWTSETQWAGGDGFFSVNLDGKDYDSARNPANKRTLFTFQDSVQSYVNPVTGLRSSSGMPNNVRAMHTGSSPNALNLSFTRNTFISTGVNNRHYWIGDNFVVGNRLYIFGSRIGNTGGDWGFYHDSTDLIRYTITGSSIGSMERFSDVNRRNFYNTTTGTAPTAPGAITWTIGSAIFENTAEAGALNPDGYIYLYGQASNNDQRRLIVARVKPADIENWSEYEYRYNNNTWQKEPWGASTSVQKYLNPEAPYEFAGECSVSEVRFGPDKGKFWHVYMDSRYFHRMLRVRTANSPYGEFTGARDIFYAIDPFFEIPEHLQDGSTFMYSYNGKAHPALSTENELIITYNVNGGTGWNNGSGDIYRPRFIRYAIVPQWADN